jgi:hypothetical protein
MTTSITLENITDGSLEGNGSFDKLMKAVTSHLQQEYDNGRIMGADYANVYTASMQGAMSQAMQFELSKVAQGAQADIALEQAKQALVQTSIVTATEADQIAISMNQKKLSDEQLTQSAVQGNILDEQAKQSLVQTAIVTATQADQIALSANQKSLSDEQLEQSLVQGSILDEQALQAEKQTSLVTTQDFVATATKLDTIAVQANQKSLSDEQVTQSGVQGDILDEQFKQAEKQTALITTQDSVATSVKQDQIDLAAAQTDLAQMQVIPNALTGI